MTWVQTCDVGDLDDGAIMRVESDVPIAIMRLDDQIYAVTDTCTHGGASLAEGWLDGDVVVCPYHMGRFCIRTGEVRSLPPTAPLTTFPTRVMNGIVFVDV